MATLTRVNPRFWRSHRGVTGPEYRGDAVATVVGSGAEPYVKEAASQTYKVGEPVYFDSNGKIAICTKSGNNLNSAILGLAARPASGTTDMPAYVAVIHPDDEYIMQVYHSIQSSATTSQSQLGKTYRIIQNTTWHVDIENTTVEDATTALAKVQCVGFPEGERIDEVKSAIGDEYGWMIVKFVEFTIEADGGNIVRNLQG